MYQPKLSQTKWDGGCWEGGRVGGWEDGRVGGWEGGRVGGWEGGRVGCAVLVRAWVHVARTVAAVSSS